MVMFRFELLLGTWINFIMRGFDFLLGVVVFIVARISIAIMRKL